jgi:hypothetical protein
MEIQVVHPTLESYADRVNELAAKYNCDAWFELVSKPAIMSDEDDRDEFAFIYHSLGDQLITREIERLSQHYEPGGDCGHIPTEPGYIPGSVVLRRCQIECSGICRIN